MLLMGELYGVEAEGLCMKSDVRRMPHMVTVDRRQELLH